MCARQGLNEWLSLYSIDANHWKSMDSVIILADIHMITQGNWSLFQSGSFDACEQLIEPFLRDLASSAEFLGKRRDPKFLQHPE